MWEWGSLRVPNNTTFPHLNMAHNFDASEVSGRLLLDPGRTSYKWISKQQAAVPADVLALMGVPISLQAMIDCLLISYTQ